MGDKEKKPKIIAPHGGYRPLRPVKKGNRHRCKFRPLQTRRTMNEQ